MSTTFKIYFVALLATACHIGEEHVCNWNREPGPEDRRACASAMAGDAYNANRRFSDCMKRMGFYLQCRWEKESE